jgi:hypothetical protein
VLLVAVLLRPVLPGSVPLDPVLAAAPGRPVGPVPSDPVLAAGPGRLVGPVLPVSVLLDPELPGSVLLDPVLLDPVLPGVVLPGAVLPAASWRPTEPVGADSGSPGGAVCAALAALCPSSSLGGLACIVDVPVSRCSGSDGMLEGLPGPGCPAVAGRAEGVGTPPAGGRSGRR